MIMILDHDFELEMFHTLMMLKTKEFCSLWTKDRRFQSETDTSNCEFLEQF